MWYIIISILFLIYFVLAILIIFNERKEEQKLGELEDFLFINFSSKKYTKYCTFYEDKKDKYIEITIDSNKKEYFPADDIMFVGCLKESGKTEIVFYPDGEKRVIVEETIESIKNKINGKS